MIPINIGIMGRCHLDIDPRDETMIGITLSSEQIRSAPAEVRRWIELQEEAAAAPGVETTVPAGVAPQPATQPSFVGKGAAA